MVVYESKMYPEDNRNCKITFASKILKKSVKKVSEVTATLLLKLSEILLQNSKVDKMSF